MPQYGCVKLPNLRATCNWVMPCVTARNSVRVTQPGVPAYAWAGAETVTSGVATAAIAVRLRRSFLMGFVAVLCSGVPDLPKPITEETAHSRRMTWAAL